ncbi:MAG: IS200/IS605 family accessory protein TnpB-related protein, partial [Xenococcaceae cyanobacterium]
RNWGLWAKICKLLSEHHISRHQLFEPTKTLEALHHATSKRKVKQTASMPVVPSNRVTSNGKSPMSQNC